MKDRAIDIMWAVQTVLKSWKQILGVTLIGFIIGLVSSNRVTLIHQAEAKIKVFTQVADRFTIQKETQDLIFQARDMAFTENFQEAFFSNPELGQKQNLNLNLEIKDFKKNPGVLEIAVRGVDDRIAALYLDDFLLAYQNFLDEKLKARNDLTVQELIGQQKKLLAKVKSSEEKLNKIDPRNILTYQQELQSSAKKGAEKEEEILEKYQLLNEKRAILEALLPMLEKASPAEICDAFNSYCTNLDQLEEGIKKDATWSIVKEYRDRETRLMLVNNKIESLRKSSSVKREQVIALKKEQRLAQNELQVFAGVTLKQLKARETLLERQAQVMLKRIKEDRDLQKKAGPELVKYLDAKKKYESLLQKISSWSNMSEEKYYFEIMNKQVNKGINAKQKKTRMALAPLVAFCLAVGVSLFLNIYKNYDGLAKSS